MTQYKMPPPVPGSPRYELREDITETQTTIPLAIIEGVPDAPNRLTFYYHGEVETIYYTGIDRETATLTGVTRGEGGTKAKAWLAGVRLSRLFCAADYEAITHNIEDHEGRVDLLETSSDTHETRIGALEVGTADHAADRTNPHQVTPAQVRNTDPQWNADQIQSIQVDTTNLGHKKTLVYNGTLDTLEFVSHDDLDGTGTHSHTDLDAHVTDLKIHRPLDDAVISGTNLWSSQKTKNEIEAVNNVTEVNTHIASLEDHRKINDTSILATELWSAQKITNELATKSETGHTHPSAEISFSEKTTDDLNEGIVNHYHTEERVKKIIRDEKGTPSGLATLGVDGKIPSSQIPPVAITDTHVVQSEAEQLALDVQKGDICVRLDLDRSYINRDGVNLGMSNWIELKSPENEVISVNGQTGAVSLTTTDIAEGTNLYYTEERVSANPTVVANTNTRHTHTNTILLDGITAPFTTELKTKLDGIEAGATADQSADEVPFTPYETISSTNVQTAIQELRDDTQTKLAEKEPTIIKKTAFNKDFGTQAGTVCHGNDSRLSNPRTPTTHTHVGTDITSVVANATTAAACSGNAASATKLKTARTLSLTGDVEGSLTFDGSANASMSVTVNGKADLDETGKIVTSQLPALAITNVSVVNSEAAQLALTVEEGDVCIRSDINKSFFALNDSNLSMDDWAEILTPGGGVLSINNLTGTVTLTAADIGAATTAYVNTATTNRSMGGYKITNLATPTATTDAATKAYADGVTAPYSIPCLIAAGRHPDTNLYLGGGGDSGIVATVPASITGGYAAGTLHTVWIQYDQSIRTASDNMGPAFGIFRSSVLVNGDVVAMHTVSVDRDSSFQSSTAGFLLTIKTGDVITVRAEDPTGSRITYFNIGRVSVSAYKSRRWIQ